MSAKHKLEEKEEIEEEMVIVLKYACKYCAHIWNEIDQPPPVQKIWKTCTRCFKLIPNMPREVERQQVMPTVYKYLGDRFLSKF